MSSVGVLLFIIAMIAIFVIDVFGISCFKTALLKKRMRKIGFLASSVMVCALSIALSLIMAKAFLGNEVIAEVVEAIDAPNAGMETVELEVEVEAEAETAIEGEMEPELDVEVELEPESTSETEPEPESGLASEPVAQTVEQEKPVVNFTVSGWNYKNHVYNFIEVENGTPYVYAPDNLGTFQYDLNNIVNNREGGNIIVMANAGVFANGAIPLGTTIQNGRILTVGEKTSLPRTLVVDEFGNVGYTTEKIENGVASYTDARTGKSVENRKIVSAVYAFTPIVMNGEAVNKSKTTNYNNYRARQIFCVKQNTYAIITNSGEGIDGGGWNFDDMTNIATWHGCVSAFNLDGGGSTAMAYRNSLSEGFSIYATTERYDPTFIVFTADNLAPRGK